ncbi:MAG: 2,3-bisphosphoglycerate-independent phosphoglycerate mutase [Patescibacteria group bacterium]
MQKKVILIILDGFGEGKDYEGNAITRAKTPTLTMLRGKYPMGLLGASGRAVGIPEGTQGGSEVGHFTMGAGRIVFQPLEEINESIKNGSFFEKTSFKNACANMKKTEKSALHLVGMISDQGVHSDIRHLFALLELAKREQAFPIFIHAITDGRDVPERTAKKFITQITNKITELGLDEKMPEGPRKAQIASIVGRYYAMDRDSNWDRTQKAYDLMTLGKGIEETDPEAAIDHAYERDVKTDYYIDPIILNKNGIIKNKDSAIFWNFRTDRARQLTSLFTGEKEITSPIAKPYFVCMGQYSEKAAIVFPPAKVQNNLGQIISDHGLSQLRIAETEKYAHVTYFLNSQIETPFAGEERLMIDSPKCASYAEKPAMSAREVTEALLKKAEKETPPLIILNFANLDLVGHSGNLQATIQAVEIIDECLGKIIPAMIEKDYTILLTGDHGNAEYMTYDEGEKKGDPCPSHTRNPVPFFVIGKEFNATTKLKENGELKDIAPTILKILNIEKPCEMTGESLLNM